MSVCICNPYAEPNAPRAPNCPIHSELARCDREIARICEEARAGIGDAHGIFQGLHDWRTEKKLIARTSHSNSQPSLNSTTKDNPSD